MLPPGGRSLIGPPRPALRAGTGAGRRDSSRALCRPAQGNGRLALVPGTKYAHDSTKVTLPAEPPVRARCLPNGECCNMVRGKTHPAILREDQMSRSKNSCRVCNHVWTPRSKAVSSRCPSCGGRDVTFQTLHGIEAVIDLSSNGYGFVFLLSLIWVGGLVVLGYSPILGAVIEGRLAMPLLWLGIPTVVGLWSGWMFISSQIPPDEDA